MITQIQLATAKLQVMSEPGSQNPALPFKPHETLSAKVLGMKGDGRVELLVNGKVVTAKTDLPLYPGEKLSLKVIQSKETIQLKLLEPESQASAKALRARLAKFFTGQTWMSGLDKAGQHPDIKEILQSVALKSGKGDGAFLPRLLEKSGLGFEHTIKGFLENLAPGDIRSGISALLDQDLKGILLKQFAAETAGAASGPLLLETLENLQLLNSQNTDSGRFFLPFPILEEMGFRLGQLFIDTGDKKNRPDGDKDRMVRVAFLLKMSRMGTVQADFSILGKSVTGRVFFEADAIRDHGASMIPDLETRLEKIGYESCGIECLTAPGKKIEPDSLIQQLFTHEDQSTVNIVV